MSEKKQYTTGLLITYSSNGAGPFNADTWKTLISSVFAPIVQGTTNKTRLGNIIRAQMLELYGCWRIDPQYTATVPFSGFAIRLLAILDRQCDGAAVPWDAIADPQGITDTNMGFMNFLPNKVSKGRYQILMDRRMVISYGASGACCFNFKVPLRNLRVSYDDITGTIADLTKYNVGVYYVLDHTANSVNATQWTPTRMDMNYRLSFTDD